MAERHTSCAEPLSVTALSSLLRGGWSSALDLIYPRRCVGCGSQGAFVCAQCRPSLVIAGPPRCPRCWKVASEICPDCSADPVIDGLRSAFLYDGPARQSVLALKYEGVSAAADELAGLMAHTLEGWTGGGDVMVPVPLHRSRRRSRGFNQSALLARGYSRHVGLEVSEGLLKRARATQSQASGLNADERRANVEGAFLAADSLDGRSVLLVDDVVTTGATIRACARALRDGGAAAVHAVSFARQG